MPGSPVCPRSTARPTAGSGATTLEVNLGAHTLLIRECLGDLLRNGEGPIVNIASAEGFGATPQISAYIASKHGAIGLRRGLAVEL